MKTRMKSLIFLCALLCRSVHPDAYYYKEATAADTLRIEIFCEEQHIEPSKLMLHLNGKDSHWAFVAMELETEEVKGLALGKTDKEKSQASIDFLYTDPKIYKLTEAQLRYMLVQLNKKAISLCVLPAQTLLKSGIRSIKTDISGMIDTFTLGTIRFEFYPNTCFINPDKETLSVLYKQSQLMHKGSVASKKSTAALIPILAKKYQEPKSGLLVAYFGDVIVGITGIWQDLTSKKNQAHVDAVVTEDGFDSTELRNELLKQITVKAHELGLDLV